MIHNLLHELVVLPKVLALALHQVNYFGRMDQGDQSWYQTILLLKVRVDWYTSSWTCRTTPHPWSCCPPGQYLWLDESGGSFWATFAISTFFTRALLHDLKLGGGWWWWCDFSVSPSPFGLDFGTSDLGLTIIIKRDYLENKKYLDFQFLNIAAIRKSFSYNTSWSSLV